MSPSTPWLVTRLAVMRIRLQVTLTPDIDYDSANPDRVRYVGMHTATSGSTLPAASTT